MTIEKTLQGYRISTMHQGYLITRLYIGYSKKEAIQQFKLYIKGK